MDCFSIFMFRLTDEVLGLTKADLKAAERSHKVAEMSKYFSKLLQIHTQ